MWAAKLQNARQNAKLERAAAAAKEASAAAKDEKGKPGALNARLAALHRYLQEHESKHKELQAQLNAAVKTAAKYQASSLVARTELNKKSEELKRLKRAEQVLCRSPQSRL